MQYKRRACSKSVSHRKMHGTLMGASRFYKIQRDRFRPVRFGTSVQEQVLNFGGKRLPQLK